MSQTFGELDIEFLNELAYGFKPKSDTPYCSMKIAKVLNSSCSIKFITIPYWKRDSKNSPAHVSPTQYLYFLLSNFEAEGET